MLKNLLDRIKQKLKQKIFKKKNPIGSKSTIPKTSFDMGYFKNMKWLAYGGSYYPYYILFANGQNYYIPYIATKRNKNGDTVMNEFLITKN
ncbi:MAG: hypothetical protein WC554_02975 [Clostridia bacterium]|jgi:hypothetical protein